MSLRRTLLLPLVPLYGAALAIERGAGSLLAGRRRALASVVISVGSISAGGAGKTPFVLLLADVLERRGYDVRILTRGYGRTGKAVERVDPRGDAARFGDEPLLLARRSGVPVFVGANRYRAGLLAEELPGAKTIVHLLDDGFQHRALARDIDIVLLTRKDVDDVLLPAGDLREPLSALGRADVLVLREDEAESLGDFAAGLERRAAEGVSGSIPVWRIRRSLALPPYAGGVTRPLVFCGIARPEGFVAMLEEAGVRPVSTMRFADHHRYVHGDVERLLDEARRHEADGFVTTEKDAVKLSPAMRSQLDQIGSLIVPELGVELIDERAAVEQLISTVVRLDRRRRR